MAGKSLPNGESKKKGYVAVPVKKVSVSDEKVPEVESKVGYYVTTPPKSQAISRSLDSTDYKYLAILTVFASTVRLYKLWQPTSVVFDEVHFGGFARKYIIGRFFMDVHPPLAKMLYAVVGYLAGYDGEFEFKSIGLDYIEPGVPYISMRLFPAVLGIFTVLLGYGTLKASGCRSLTALFGAALLTIDNGLTTQSRFILLDSPLIFFIAITAYAFTKFSNEIPFTRNWYRYLFLTGLGLGATVSSKWVGLFTIGWIGLLTVWQLWWILGDLSVTPKKFIYHFTARSVFLIGVPLVFYMAMFALHFICLTNDGDGASFLSPEFQSTLQHSKLTGAIPADVAYGSKVTIRHWNTQGGYLHSHDHMYETGSKQQQITLYPHKDENNVWVVENHTLPEQGRDYFDTIPPIFVEDGATIRLRHLPSFRRLHSHDFRPPVSEQDFQNEVSAYGYEEFEGDANDNFRVEIVKDKSANGVSQNRLRTLETKFRLIHTITGCALFSHSVKLPKWGFEQQEVTCIKNGKIPNSIWFVEENTHSQLGADAELVSYRKPSFLEKFIELNQVMWKVNAGLTDTHTWESRPPSWPILKRGINFFVKDNTQVYLLGNAPVWWSVTGIILIYVLTKLVLFLRWQRGFNDLSNDSEFSKADSAIGSYLLGWALHYFPSFLMARQLFLHHYLGSLYFGILALVQFWEYLTVRIIKNKLIGYAAMGLFFSVAASFFVWYSPLIYADPWTTELCEKSKFLDMDFDCGSFLSSYDEYSKRALESAGSISQTSTAAPVEPSDIQVASTPESVQIKAEGSAQEGPLSDPVDIKENENKVEISGSETFVNGEPATKSLIGREEIIQYKDVDGNLLNPEDVSKLVEEGKVKLQTIRNTNDKIFDENGNEIVL